MKGVHFRAHGATSQSLVMRSRSGTVRRVHARHDIAKLREVTGGVVRFEDAIFAIPKSVIFTFSSAVVTMMLAGLMSRWMIPLRWA